MYTRGVVEHSLGFNTCYQHSCRWSYTELGGGEIFFLSTMMHKPRIGNNQWIALLKARIRALREQSIDCTTLAQSRDCATYTCMDG